MEYMDKIHDTDDGKQAEWHIVDSSSIYQQQLQSPKSSFLQQAKSSHVRLYKGEAFS